MANADKVIDHALDPYVTTAVNSDGTVDVELCFDRKKRNGDYDFYTVRFDRLDEWQMACVGRKVRVALDEAGHKAWRANRMALAQVTGAE